MSAAPSATTASAPFPPFDDDAAFRSLRDLIRGERPPLALVGAGASLGSGYPSWHGLLEVLREQALSGDKADWRRSMTDLSDAPWTAEVFAGRLKKGGLGELIRGQFATRKSLAEPHLTLARMAFPHYLTTNYDPSIEEALAAAGRDHTAVVWPGGPGDHADAEALSDFLISLSSRQARTRVVYLHGRFDSAEDRIVLTESDYVARYIASDDARRKLMAIFLTHPVLFVGFSMNDPDLANLMREVTARLRTTSSCHYALMGYKGEADREATRARMLGKFGVQPVFFSRTPVTPDADEFSNLLLLLDALHGKNMQRKTPEAKVKRVTFDPDDPNRGQFGGKAADGKRRLSVVKLGGSEERQSLDLEFRVEAEAGAEPLSGKVLFHLHPTFGTQVVTVQARKGAATLKRWAYGAFTVGVVCDDGDTRLELDLAEEPSLPMWFRRQ